MKCKMYNIFRFYYENLQHLFKKLKTNNIRMVKTWVIDSNLLAS